MKKILLSLFAIVAVFASANATDWEVVKTVNLTTTERTGFGQFADATTDTRGGFTVNNPAQTTNNYELQYHGMSGISVEPATNYKLEITMSANGNGNLACAVCNWGNNGSNGSTIAFTSGTKTYSYQFTTGAAESASDYFVMLQSGHYVGSYTLQTITVYKEKEVLPEGVVKTKKWFDITNTTHVIKTPVDGFNDWADNLEVEVPAKTANSWDSQVWFVLNEALAEKTNVKLVFDAKASASATCGGGYHGVPDGNNWKGGLDGVTISTEWKTYTLDYALAAGAQSIAFDLAQATDMVYNFKNVKILKGIAAEEISYTMDADINVVDAEYNLLASKELEAQPVKALWYKDAADLSIPAITVGGYSIDALTIEGAEVEEEDYTSMGGPCVTSVSYAATNPDITFNTPEGPVKPTSVNVSGNYQFNYGDEFPATVKISVVLEFADGKQVYISFRPTGSADDVILPTAIEKVEVAKKAAKYMQNGKLVIVKNGKTYNAAGQLVK